MWNSMFPTWTSPFAQQSETQWSPGEENAAPEEQMEILRRRYGPAFLTGNGLTGLSSADSLGYSRMLNDRLTYLRLANQVQNKPQPNVQYGGTITPQVQRTFTPATGRDNTRAFGHGADISGAAIEGLQAAGEKTGKLDEVNRAMDRARWSRF